MANASSGLINQKIGSVSMRKKDVFESDLIIDDVVLYRKIAEDIMENILGINLKSSRNKNNIYVLAEILEEIDT